MKLIIHNHITDESIKFKYVNHIQELYNIGLHIGISKFIGCKINISGTDKCYAISVMRNKKSITLTVYQ